jgi:hypothetical protein
MMKTAIAIPKPPNALAEADRRNRGAPQCAHAPASLLTSWPHSVHSLSAMFSPFSAKRGADAPDARFLYVVIPAYSYR